MRDVTQIEALPPRLGAFRILARFLKAISRDRRRNQAASACFYGLELRLSPKIGLVDVHEGAQAIRAFLKKLLTTLKQEKIFTVALLPGMAHQLNRC